MKIKKSLVAIAALAVGRGMANGAFVEIVAMERPMSTPEELIIGVYAVYDSPADLLFGISNPASFSSTLPLYNAPGGADVNVGIDYDSWVAAGANVGQTVVTPGWPGGPGIGSDFVSGTSWTVPNGEAWAAWPPPGPPASQSDDGLANHLLIANFAFAPTSAGTESFTLEGEVVGPGDGAPLYTPFSITHTFPVIPTPGALAALGVAGLAGGGRRRR